MEHLKIEGGRKLCGEVQVQGAKNAVLPLLAACILTDETVSLQGVPPLTDVRCMGAILKELGCRVKMEGDTITVDSSSAASHLLPSALTKELRSSVFMLGSVLSRFKRAKIAYPGGCDIGLRPIDLHLSGLKRLGVTIREEDGFICCEADKLRGAEILLDFPSVGATENIMLAAVKAEGVTVLKNAAKEPEIVDLQSFLNRMGARVRGAGHSTVVIEGVKKLKGVAYTPIKDRIEAGTFLIAAALCGGEVEINGIEEENISSLLHKLRENGCKIHIKNDKIILRRISPLLANKLIQTSPFPGFPTDLQAPMLALNTVANGTCVVEENLFETRFHHVPELKKMGADVVVKDRTAIVRGVSELHAAEVFSKDLRGGAALVIAALRAQGVSRVMNCSFIDRGYAFLEDKFNALGAKVERVES